MAWLSEDEIARADLRYADEEQRYSPDQARDEHGRWGDGSGVMAEHNADPNKVGAPVPRYAAHISAGEHIAKGYGASKPTHQVLGAKQHFDRGAVGQVNLHVKDLATGKESHTTHSTYEGFTSFPKGRQLPASMVSGPKVTTYTSVAVKNPKPNEGGASYYSSPDTSEHRFNDAAKIATAEPDASSGSVPNPIPLTAPGDVNGNFTNMSPQEQAQHMADKHGYLIEQALGQGQYLAGLHARDHLAATTDHQHK